MHITAALHITHYPADVRKWGCAMDAKYFREKAELCLRLADGLSLNNPGRFQLMDLAEDFRERAEELEAQAAHKDEHAGTHGKA
jgi:hypothetical protein